ASCLGAACLRGAFVPVTRVALALLGLVFAWGAGAADFTGAAPFVAFAALAPRTGAAFLATFLVAFVAGTFVGDLVAGTFFAVAFFEEAPALPAGVAFVAALVVLVPFEAFFFADGLAAAFTAAFFVALAARALLFPVGFGAAARWGEVLGADAFFAGAFLAAMGSSWVGMSR